MILEPLNFGSSHIGAVAMIQGTLLHQEVLEDLGIWRWLYVKVLAGQTTAIRYTRTYLYISIPGPPKCPK